MKSYEQDRKGPAWDCRKGLRLGSEFVENIKINGRYDLFVSFEINIVRIEVYVEAFC